MGSFISGIEHEKGEILPRHKKVLISRNSTINVKVFLVSAFGGLKQAKQRNSCVSAA